MLASYAVAIGLQILLLVAAMPFVGVSGAADLMFDHSKYLFPAFTVLGGVVCYRHMR